MKTTSVKLSALNHLEKNPRRHPNLQIQELMRSLTMFGQIRPLVIDETNTVLAGNGMLLAMRELGWEKADALLVADLNDRQKKKLILADNKVASLGADDYSVIEELIRDLKDELDIPGFDDEVLKSLVATPVELANISANYGAVSEEAEQQAVKRREALAAAVTRAENAVEANNSSRESKICESCGQTVWL